ncbi:DUF4296 domain-containing protein [Flavivirga eckloniae]|uniref:DUF4296 domain-containing protein n=1 Tax=Flavivirga eckloniae TaxID=1803846 RepID=A0A2K9PS65_9FLAO|nr:DUF4296 domain-containing protein [Flavivirga eckloniae]AUP79912.1 hypothetical protein C1H87_14850 [Flavivirga eckloniae]
MILKRVTLCLGILIAATACYNMEKPEKPHNLISKEKMVDIIIDAKLIASASTVNRKMMEDHGVNVNTYVYEKHNIDSLQFALSNSYYAFYAKDYEAIYVKVKDSLEALKVKFREEEEQLRIEKAKRKSDSLKLIFKEMDSLGLVKYQDSLKVIKKKDTLVEKLVQEVLHEKKGLIAPISDKDPQ